MTELSDERLSDIELQDLIALASVGGQRSILLAAHELLSLRQSHSTGVVAWIPNTDYQNENTWPPSDHPLSGLFHKARLQWPHNSDSRADYEAIAGWALSALATPPDEGLGEKVKSLAGMDYMIVHDAAQAAYEAATPSDYRYSATALRKAVDAGLAAAAALQVRS